MRATDVRKVLLLQSRVERLAKAMRPVAMILTARLWIDTAFPIGFGVAAIIWGAWRAFSP